MRIRLTVAYAGGRYAGWQVQPDRPTVQGELEAAVARVAGSPVRVTGASRTDAGVHAAGQVCHFDALRRLPPATWKEALNGLLPADLRVLRAREASPDFHARYGARRKAYRYHLDTAPVASPFLAPYAWHRPGLRELEALREAAAALVGPVDQRAFASRPEGDRWIRPVGACEVEVGRLVTITLAGRSFLRHAIRGMVGSLVQVGQGTRSVQEFAAMLEQPAPAFTLKAPPHGLCLVRVEY